MQQRLPTRNPANQATVVTRILVWTASCSVSTWRLTGHPARSVSLLRWLPVATDCEGLRYPSPAGEHRHTWLSIALSAW